MLSDIDNLLSKRGLPKLTATNSSKVVSSTTSYIQSTSATSNSSISLLDSSSFLSSSSSIATPTISPPSPNGNPYIINIATMPPRGTVFIAVGACVGAIFLAILVWWAISSYISHKNAKYSKGTYYNQMDYGRYKMHTHQNSVVSQITESTYSDNNSSNFDQDEKKFFMDNKSRRSIFNLKSNNRAEEFNDDMISININEPEHLRFNAIQDNTIGYNNRKSLFISPTLEVTQHQHQKSLSRNSDIQYIMDEGNQSTLSLDSAFEEEDLDRPSRAASPERKKKNREDYHYHARNQSSLGLIGTDSTPSSPTKKGNPFNNKFPSMYLDDMLRDP